MKILFVISSTTLYGGASKSLLNLIYGLKALGVSVFVVCPDRQGLYLTLQDDGIPVFALSYRPATLPPYESITELMLFIPRLIGRYLLNFSASIKLTAIARAINPHIIHTNVSVISIGYNVSRRIKIPHVWHIREYGDLDFNLHFYYTRKKQLKRYTKEDSYTICITKDIQRYNKLQLNINSRVIYNGISSTSNTSYSNKKVQYFLFAGRLEHAKGIISLIDAYASYYRITKDPLPLHIAGEGDANYVGHLLSLIDSYGIADKVQLLGMQKDIVSLYQEAIALIVPSLSEGFGRVTAEAMFHECLVIGNDVAGSKEQFDNGKELTGDEIALRYTTQEQLVKHLIDVSRKPIKHYEPMILRAKETVEQLYSIEQHIQQVYKFYNVILHQL
jgi:glycosyltransferase involved in cell wall biosynthesis